MYSIQDVSQKTGLSSHTLRYYEKEGLISGVCRSQGGFRQYTDEDLDRLGLVCCLKNTGMSIHEISRFMQLSREGSHTLAERVDMLLSHRKRMTARIEEMQKNLETVDWKINFFSEQLRAYESGKADENSHNRGQNE